MSAKAERRNAKLKARLEERNRNGCTLYDLAINHKARAYADAVVKNVFCLTFGRS